MAKRQPENEQSEFQFALPPAEQLVHLLGGGGAVSGRGNRVEKMQLDLAARLADNHADGLPQADVAVVGGVGVGAAAVGIGVAA